MRVWYKRTGPEDDVVLSTRIRLARNLKDFLFLPGLGEENGEKIIKICENILKESNFFNKKLTVLRMENLSPVEKQALVEEHLMSPEMMGKGKGAALFLKEDGGVSLMVGEEDHLRIQCLLPGFDLKTAWEMTEKTDDLLEEKLDFAFDKNYGYLTACPTNTGTGLRASVMLHLPGITARNQQNSLFNAVTKLGLTVRGIYGEGTQGSGHVFQISNQITMGLSETETIEKLTNIIGQIISAERNARKELSKSNKIMFEDKIWRAYSILKGARIISSTEAMKHISDVRLGAYAGEFPELSKETVGELMIMIQPAQIIKKAGRELTQQERDIVRAEWIREKLK